MRSSSNAIPVGPILARAERFIEQHNFIPSREDPDRLVGGQIIFEAVCGVSYNHLRKRKHLTFDVADRILCKIGNGLLDWITDPVLSEIYPTVDLGLNRRELALLGKTDEIERRKREYAQGNRRRVQKRKSMKQILHEDALFEAAAA